MTRDFDDRLRDFLADEARRVVLDAPSMDAAVGGLAIRLRPRPARSPGRLVVLLAAAMLLIAAFGSAIAIGSGLVRLPLVNDVPAPLESQDSASLEPRSADGDDVIAYATESGLSPLFFVRRGDEPRQIASSDIIGNDVVCPTFSPDGTLLAVGMPAGSIVVFPVDEQGLTGEPGRRLDTGAGESPHCPAWAPDSSALALLDASTLVILSLSGEQQRIDGWDVAVKFRDDFSIDHLADRAVQWSPDGSAVAVARPSGTWVVPVNGTAPRRLHETPAFSVSWSPDGTRLVVGAEGPSALVIELADGRTLAELPSQYVPSMWSPVEDRIALSDAEANLVVVRPDGTDRVVIDDYGYNPTWSSDGRQLLYIQDVAGAAWRLMIANADGSGEPAVVVRSVTISDARSFPGAEQLSWQPVPPPSR